MIPAVGKVEDIAVQRTESGEERLIGVLRGLGGGLVDVGVWKGGGGCR